MNQQWTYDISSGHPFFFSMLLFDDLFQFLFVPILHCIVFVLIAHININTSLLNLTLHRQIMREFAFVTFGTLASFEEGAHHGLRIGAFFDFLRLNWPTNRVDIAIFSFRKISVRFIWTYRNKACSSFCSCNFFSFSSLRGSFGPSGCCPPLFTCFSTCAMNFWFLAPFLFFKPKVLSCK